MNASNELKMQTQKAIIRIIQMVMATLALPGTYGADRGAIESGETKIGYQITGPGQIDTWTFSGAQGDRVVIAVTTTSGQLTPYINLYPPGGGTVERGAVNRLDWQLKTSGLYTIEIEDFVTLSDTGTYNITLLKMPGTVNSTLDPDGGPIASGQTVSGTINVSADMDAYNFYGQTGYRVVIAVTTTSGQLTPNINLYPPGGGMVERGAVNRLDWQLKTNGLYTIEIEDFVTLSDTGNYNITLLKMPGTVNSMVDPDGGLIASGQTGSGTINVSADMDAYNFYGQTGDRVVIAVTTTSGQLTPYINLYPPKGGTVEYGAVNRLDWQLKTNGLYTIEIEDFVTLSDTGTYNLTLSKIPSSSPGIYGFSPANASAFRLATTPSLLIWSVVPTATGYDLYFGDNAAAQLARIGTGFGSPSFPLPACQTGHTYVWQVVAYTAGGVIQGPCSWFTVLAPPFQLAQPTLLPNRSVRLSIQGQLAQPVRLQATTDLRIDAASWTTLTTLSNLSGSFEYTDSASTNLSRRFYRAVSP